jgi:purine-nucleoside phosphorylase
MTPAQEQRAAEMLLSTAQPEAAVILGTGLGVLEESISIREALDYRDIPGFPISSVKGHSGRLLFGTLGGKSVAVMSGRFHLYEGYTPKEVTFPIRVFSRMGIQRLLISNAAGGLRKDLEPGNAMLITDHINLTCRNPLIGPNIDELGPRFPVMTEPYAPSLLGKARQYAFENHIDLKEGVYAQLLGPSLETAAETRMLQIIGADAVGMSTVMEVIQAVHSGMEVLAVSAITNQNDPDNYLPAPLEEIIAMAGKAGPIIAKIFSGILESL